jgi:hypothetical protein
MKIWISPPYTYLSHQQYEKAFFMKPRASSFSFQFVSLGANSTKQHVAKVYKNKRTTWRTTSISSTSSCTQMIIDGVNIVDAIAALLRHEMVMIMMMIHLGTGGDFMGMMNVTGGGR